MIKKYLCAVIVCCLGFCLSAGISLASEGKEAKEQSKIVNKIVIINEYEEVSPLVVTSTPGTTIVWVNNSRSPVEILFYNKEVTMACGSPVNFFVGRGGAYESNKIPFGGTASLCFVENGTFEYMIKSSRTFYMKRLERESKGKIVIE